VEGWFFLPLRPSPVIMEHKKKKLVLVYFINVDWYFRLHWLERAKASITAGYEVHLLTHFTDEAIIDEFSQEGLICHHVSLDRSSLSLFSAAKTLCDAYKIIKRLGPDLLHCATVKPNIFGGLAARALKIPSLFSVTGLGLAFSGADLQSKVAKYIIINFYKIILNRKNYRVIFENRDDKETFERLGIGNPELFEVIAGAGVDVNRFPFSPPASETRIKLLFASRMLWDKGIGDAIEAGKILRQRGLDFDLNVAGIIDYQSPNAVPEAQIVKWHHVNHINWLGYVTNMAQLIRGSDIVLLPTCYGEGVPRILIEAASIGRCIITTDVAGCRDIVKDGSTGFLVPIKDPAALAGKIEILMGDERLRRNMGLEARKLVEKKWDQEIVIKRTLSVGYELVK